jgi:hypothetical protein
MQSPEWYAFVDLIRSASTLGAKGVNISYELTARAITVLVTNVALHRSSQLANQLQTS